MEIADRLNLREREKRGSFEGAIRIPLHASLFPFNDLAFRRISRKSFRFLTLLLSIPTAPTKSSQRLGAQLVEYKYILRISGRDFRATVVGSRRFSQVLNGITRALLGRVRGLPIGLPSGCH